MMMLAILLVACEIAGYMLSTSIWNFIFLPFNNPFGAVGKLALAEFNPLNNYLRWLVFILLPTSLLVLVFKVQKA